MDFLTLSQLNTLVANEIKQNFPDSYWVMAETSDVRLNRNGHCYLELIEKKENGTILAKTKAYIWSNTFQLLNTYFEQKTGQPFVSGIKVLVKVSIEFHLLYGYGLSICDIDPTYTLGDVQRNRQEILRKLEEDGVLTLNKELELKTLPQRIAVITSQTAAGYEDFLEQLNNNKEGLVFYPHIFPAVMQGERTEQSVIKALERVYEYKDSFDVVVIIRGGGATSDLLAFDSYLLAAHCAQFPLPIITGIGHERDDTILDFVAYYRAKTPTAVADYLVELLSDKLNELLEVQTEIISSANKLIQSKSEDLQQLSKHLPFYIHSFLERQNYALQALATSLIQSRKQIMVRELNSLNEKEAFFKLSSPEYILSKGYSITLKNGKAVKSATDLVKGDCLRTVLFDGEVKSVVK